MKIETAQQTDLDNIQALVADTSEHDVLPLLSEEGRQVYQEHVVGSLASTLDPKTYVSIKAELDGQLVGYASLRDGNYLTHLFVSKSSQGSGLGKALLDALLSGTENEQVTLRSSINAVSFYQKHGFVTTGPEDQVHGIRFVPMSWSSNNA